MSYNRSKRGVKPFSCGNCNSCGKPYDYSSEKLQELKASFKIKGCQGDKGQCGSPLLLTCWEANHRCSECFSVTNNVLTNATCNVESEKEKNHQDDNGEKILFELSYNNITIS